MKTEVKTPDSPSVEQVRQLILEAVNKGKKVTLITYTLTNAMEEMIEFALNSILDRYGQTDLQTALYSITKELVVNGTKANAKKIFLEERGLCEDNDSDECVSVIHKELSEDWINKYGRMAREQNLEVRASFEHTADGLRIYIINNLPLNEINEKRIRKNLEKGMQFDNIAEFYMQQAMNGEESEGAGMGLVMNLLMLKGENIDPNLFRIGVIDNKTFARVEIPFTDNFVSVRGSNPAGHTEKKA